MDLTVLAATAAELVWPLVRGALAAGADAGTEAGTGIVREEAAGVGEVRASGAAMHLKRAPRRLVRTMNATRQGPGRFVRCAAPRLG